MKKFDQINVIPMIDIMLVLLAIVLTTASFMVQDQLNITLPQTQNTQPAPQPKQALQLSINAQGQIFLNNQPLTLSELEYKLNTTPKDHPIILKVDQKATFGRFTQIIDLLKAQHKTQLTILTEHKKS